MATTDQGVYVKLEDVPETIAAELRLATESYGLTWKAAIAFLFERIGDELAEGGSRSEGLQRAIFAGQIARNDFEGIAVEQLGAHIPLELREEISAAADAVGVKRLSAGRFVLLGQAERIDEILRPRVPDSPELATAAP